MAAASASPGRRPYPSSACRRPREDRSMRSRRCTRGRRGPSSSIVFVAAAHPILRKVVAGFVASLGREIDVMIRAVEHVDAARKGRVGVENVFAARLVLGKRADADHVLAAARLLPLVVPERGGILRLIRRERRKVVEVKIATERR